MSKTVLAELVTQMTVESTQFKKELEKATAKTHAQGKASKKAANDADGFGMSLKGVADKANAFRAKVMGSTAAIVAMSAALYANTNRSATNAKELLKLSELSGETVENFQSLAFAFESVGVEQEKFADISKDVQDKLGDFLATGAGPFKDFFENVGYDIGLTANALRDLSSTDVLIAVKTAMDAANVSAKEQVFYMEAIANDATLLIPALANGGKQIKDFAEKYDSLNVAISETDAEKLKEFGQEAKIQAVNFSALGDALAISTLPYMKEFTSFLGGASATLKSFFTGDDSIESLSHELKQLQWIPEDFAPKQVTERIDFLINKIQALKDQAEFEKISSASIDDILTGAFTNLSETVGGVGQADAKAYAEKTFETIQVAMQEQADFVKESGAISELLTNGVFSIDLENLSSEQQNERDLWADHFAKMQEQADLYAQKRQSSQLALEANIFSVTASYANQTAGMIANAAEEGSAAQKAAFLAQQAIAVATTIVNTEMASIAALSELGPTVGMPYSKLIKSMGYVSAGLIAGQAIGSFDGGGYTGDGARTAGLDGKGGFMAMLHPQETVIDHTKGQHLTGPQTTQHISIAPQLVDASGWDQWYKQNRNRITRDIRSAGRV